MKTLKVLGRVLKINTIPLVTPVTAPDPRLQVEAGYWILTEIPAL